MDKTYFFNQFEIEEDALRRIYKGEKLSFLKNIIGFRYALEIEFSVEKKGEGEKSPLSDKLLVSWKIHDMDLGKTFTAGEFTNEWNEFALNGIQKTLNKIYLKIVHYVQVMLKDESILEVDTFDFL